MTATATKPDRAPPPPLRVIDRSQDGTTILLVAGRIDSTTGPTFGAQLDALCAQPADGVRDMILDLAEVEFISSAGLRVLLVALRRLRATGRQLALCEVRPQVREVLEITGFHTMLPAYPDQRAALAALGR